MLHELKLNSAHYLRVKPDKGIKGAFFHVNANVEVYIVFMKLHTRVFGNQR